MADSGAPERLSALDQSFLLLEHEDVHMHVASAMVFERGPLARPDGGIRFEALRDAIDRALERVPRYRQRVEMLPVLGGAYWVDDPDFDLDAHLKQVALPRPGNREQLARMTAEIMERPLDRRRPLWEMWVVEGVAPDHFALVTKVHHSMVDGVAGVELMLRMLSPDPRANEPAVADGRVRRGRRQREAPSRTGLVAREIRHRLGAPLGALKQVGGLRDGLTELRDEAFVRVAGLARTLARALRPAPPSPFNGPVGGHRRYATVDQDLREVRSLARACACTVNDIVLATVAGALRFALRRAGNGDARAPFRVLAPVSMRSEQEKKEGVLGNRISMWFIDLPVHRRSALARVREIRRETEALKASRDALGAEVLSAVSEWTSATLLSAGARAAARLHPFNLIVTNVPGPQIPLYLCGARLGATYPVAPLFDEVRLNIALLSYDGGLYWGLNADYEAVADLDLLAKDIEAAFAELRNAVAQHERHRTASGKEPHEPRSQAE